MKASFTAVSNRIPETQSTHIHEPLRIDLVIPCFNEAATAPHLVREIEAVILKAKLDLDPDIEFGIIIIDDGSKDETRSVFSFLLKGSQAFGRRTILSFSRNFGKEAALNAGLEYCQGDACIILDADLQDPPSLIHEMIKAWIVGYKVVNAVRVDRASDSAVKRITAQAFYSVFARVSHLDIQFNSSDFRLLDQTVVNAILSCPERVRFSKGFFAWVGFQQTSIYFKRPERQAGSSKWGGWKLWNYALDGIFNFSTAPLRIWSYVGFSVTFLTFIQGFIVLFRTVFLGIELPGYASLFLAVSFLGGLQLMGIGIIGEYIGRIYMETKCRPHYILKEVIELASGLDSRA
jgi:polyisoprenyl-phosphate glycosyltransferase